MPEARRVEPREPQSWTATPFSEVAEAVGVGDHSWKGGKSAQERSSIHGLERQRGRTPDADFPTGAHPGWQEVAVWHRETPRF